MELESKRIVFLGLKRIGDAVYTLQTFEAIKRANPSAFITVLTEPQVKDIYQGNPFIDEVVSFSKKDFWKQSLKCMKGSGYDVCIVNHNAFKYALLPFLARIPVRVGYIKEARGWLLTHKRSLHQNVVHRVEHNALLLDLLAIESRGLLPRIYVDESEAVASSALMRKLGLVSGGFVAFIVGSIAQTRRWFPKNFAQVAHKIITELGLKVIILGGPDDKNIAKEVTRLVGDNDQFLNLAGETSLRETILLFQQAKAIVTNDTGPLHVASALNVPVITWFGAANEKEIAPLSQNTTILNAHVSCSPCVKEICPYQLECLTAITPDMVFESLKSSLQRNGDLGLEIRKKDVQ